jgi:hypothetical protein
MFTKRLISALLITILFFSAIGTAYWTMRPPNLPSENSPNYEHFIQMLTNIEIMSQQPHPAGSEKLAGVRAYLTSQLDEMGAQYKILDAPVSGERHFSGGNVEAYSFTLYNILVKIDSPVTEQGVLFSAHYDSRPDSPGAVDDMTGVCALLETVRRQVGNPNLQNDLYFLFTDGEEMGHLGAEAFVRGHREYSDLVEFVVNMDAHGTSGGLLMFETSKYDYELVHHFRNASSHSISYSWLPMIYRQMPNGSDLTEFLNFGYSGLNFAVIEGLENYSSPSETFEAADRRTAYNFLETAFNISDYIATTALDKSANHNDGVYFTLLPRFLILMTDTTSHIMSGITLLFSLIWFVWQIRKRTLKLRPVLAVSGIIVGVIIAVAVLAQAVSVAVIKLEESEILNIVNNSEGLYINTPIFAICIVILGAVLSIIFAKLTLKRSFDEILGGILLLMAVLSVVSDTLFNAASYLFSLPAMGLVVVAFLANKKIVKTTATIIVGFCGLLLFTPPCWIIYSSLGLVSMPIISTIMAFPIILVAPYYKLVFSHA